MREVLSDNYNERGFGNLEEALEITREDGIAIARQALHPDVVQNITALANGIGTGEWDIPGILEVRHHDGTLIHQVFPQITFPELEDMLTGVESRINEAAEDNLPNWRPTQMPLGTRVDAMHASAPWSPMHTDKYEGLLASILIAAEGIKTIYAQIEEKTCKAVVNPGDITLLAGKGFSDKAPVWHNAWLSGAYAVAFTLGADPYYRIDPNEQDQARKQLIRHSQYYL